MKKLIAYLKHLDFSEIEAQLYLTLLATGPLTATQLAKSAKINRTAAYGPIKALQEKGILMEITIGSHKQFAAIEPDQLYYLIDRKSDYVKSLQNKFPEFINSINATLDRKPLHGKVLVKYFLGKNNAIALYKEAFKSTMLRSFVKILAQDNFFSIPLFFDAFRGNSKIKMREIIYDSSSATKQILELQQLAKHHNNYSYKLMPSNVKLSGNDILIFDNKVVIIEFTESIKCVVLHSESYYNNLKELFDFIWQILPEPSPDSK